MADAVDGGLERSSYSSLLRKVASSEALQFQYQHSVGHEGKVLCNDASDDMEWILSGGEDCTARLWHYNETHYQCYRLYLVINHEPCSNPSCDAQAEEFPLGINLCPKCHTQRRKNPENPAEVTSVAFAGNRGPAVTATKQGDIWITSITHRRMTRFDSSNDAISDVRVKREEYKGKDDWLLAIAAGSRATLTEASPSSDDNGAYVCKTIAFFDHDKESVRSAQHVPGKVETGAALVTAASMYIRVWALPEVEGENGIQLLCLEDVDHRTFNCFHVQESSQGWGWLAAGAGNFLSFWPLCNGKVYHEENHTDWPVRYRFSDQVCDVSIGPNCEFFMVQRADMTSELRQIVVSKSQLTGELTRRRSFTDVIVRRISSSTGLGDHPDCVKALGDHPGNLPRSGTEATLCTIEHTVESSEVCMRKVGENMQALLSFHNGIVGVWDMQGTHMSEQTAEIRSMDYVHIMTPFLIRLVTFVQISLFAFGPATKFSDDVEEPIKITASIVFLNVTSVLPEFLEVTPSMLFLPEISLTMATMLLYLILVFTAAPEKLAAAKTKLMRSKGYIEKTCCSRLSLAFISLFRSGIGLLIFACSTVLVVPMFKTCATVVDCDHPEDGSKPFLSAQPHIHCYEDTYWKLASAFALVVPIYFAALLPYAVVNGDSRFMSRTHLSSPAIWEQQAMRKATLSYQGPVHPECRSIFVIRVAELLTKIALPVIVILSNSHPLLQTVLIAACGLSTYVINLVWRPLVNSVMCTVYQSMELFQFLCMCIGVATVAFPAGKHWDGVTLLAAFAVSVATVFFQIRRVREDELETDEMRSLGSFWDGVESDANS